MSQWNTEKHIKIIIVFLIIEAVIGLAMSAMAGIVAAAFACDAPTADQSTCMAIGAGFFFIMAFFVTGLPAACAVGLKLQTWWGRNLTIIYAAILCLGFPLGTMLGIYKLLVVFRLERQHTKFLVLK